MFWRILAVEFASLFALVVAVLICSLPLNDTFRCALKYLYSFIVLTFLPLKREFTDLASLLVESLLSKASLRPEI